MTKRVAILTKSQDIFHALGIPDSHKFIHQFSTLHTRGRYLAGRVNKLLGTDEVNVTVYYRPQHWGDGYPVDKNMVDYVDHHSDIIIDLTAVDFVARDIDIYGVESVNALHARHGERFKDILDHFMDYSNVLISPDDARSVGFHNFTRDVLEFMADDLSVGDQYKCWRSYDPPPSVMRLPKSTSFLSGYYQIRHFKAREKLLKNPQLDRSAFVSAVMGQYDDVKNEVIKTMHDDALWERLEFAHDYTSRFDGYSIHVISRDIVDEIDAYYENSPHRDRYTKRTMRPVNYMMYHLDRSFFLDSYPPKTTYDPQQMGDYVGWHFEMPWIHDINTKHDTMSGRDDDISHKYIGKYFLCGFPRYVIANGFYVRQDYDVFENRLCDALVDVIAGVCESGEDHDLFGVRKFALTQ